VQQEDREKRELRDSTVIMVVSGVSALVVIVLLVAGGYFVIQALTAPARSGNSTIPYGINARPVPNPTSLDALLKPALGQFRRTTVGGSIANFTAQYSNGTDRITISGSEAVSLIAAVASVQKMLQTYGQSGLQQRIEDSDTSYSYYLNTSSSRPIFAWSHERWFFSIQASSKAALDEFMKFFEY